jgi:hypothetical protein
LTTSEAARGTTPDVLAGLRRWNVALTVLHGLQAVAVLVLASAFSISVTSSFPEGPPGTRTPPGDPLFDIPIGVAIAAFLALAAIDHLLTGTVVRGRYERGLAAGINRFRWVEYSFSATIMILLIALYAGITEITALIAIIGANVAMILFGWLQEAIPPGPDGRTSLLPFWFGCIAGIAPWLAITVNLVGADTVPGFVYGIFFSLFAFFISFAVNQWLQYRGIGPWRVYTFGEKAYLVLSLIAKSALAWQIFAGSLAG